MSTSSAAPLRIVFAGTPDFAACSLAALINDSPHQVVGVYTQPDRPAGRGRKLAASPVKQLAEQHEIPVFQPVSFKNHHEQEKLASLNPDVMVVVAYGLILPPLVLDIPKLGCINVHASLLPRWRGAAPIQRAILAGDQETGITIMQMDAGLDSGDSLLQAACPIESSDTGSTLHDRLADQGAECLLKALEDLPALQQKAIPQNHHEATYAHKLDKQQARIDWQYSAEQIARLVRAFNSWPVAYSELGDSRVRIWEAEPLQQSHNAIIGSIVGSTPEGIDVACGNGLLRLKTVQLPGAKALPVSAVLNARQDLFSPGQRFA
ncbi:MAG: methionyl-tRNA formyltransferase [Pseudomonadales bacterium]